MTSKVFITGGSGLLALNWAIAIRDSHNVTLGLHKQAVKIHGVNTQKIDLDSDEHLTQVFDESGTNIVLHAAGFTNIEACEASPAMAWHINVNLANNVAEACAKLRLPLIHISTDHLYAGHEPMLDEFCVLKPLNVYGKTKAEAEALVLESHPDSLVIRTNFFGWGSSYRQSFSDMIISSLRSGKELKLFTDVYYTPILAETLASAVHDLVKLKASGVVNVVGGERISKYNFGIDIARVFGLDAGLIKPSLLSNNVGLVKRPLDMSLSNQKACQLLGRELGSVTDGLIRLHQQEQIGQAREIGIL